MLLKYSLEHCRPIELPVMIEACSLRARSRHCRQPYLRSWLLSTWKEARVTEEPHFKFYSVLINLTSGFHIVYL